MARVDETSLSLENLFTSIKDDKSLDVKVFLEGYDVSNKELKWSGLSALGLAVSRRNVDLVKMLLKHGVNVNVCGDQNELGLCPIHYLFIQAEQSEEERRTFLKELEDPKCQKQSTKDELMIAELLAKSGANLDSCPKDEFGNPVGYSPLIYAVRYNDINFAKFLVDHGVDANSTGICPKGFEHDSTPLFYAAKNGYIDMVQFLLSNNADVNPKGGELPLIGCSDNLEMTQFLLFHGADPNHVQEMLPFDTPILHAFIHGNLECVQALIKHGVKLTHYPNTVKLILQRLTQNRCGAVRTIHFLIHSTSNTVHDPEFVRYAVSLLARDIKNYKYIDAFLEAGLVLQKCGNLGKFLTSFFNNSIQYPEDFKGCLKMLHIMTKHGVRMANHESYLKKMKTPSGTTVQHKDLYAWLCKCSSNPLTLQELCRLKVRQECVHSFTPMQGMQYAMEKLPLPTNVKDFLLFKENELPNDWNKCHLCDALSYECRCDCQKKTKTQDSESDSTGSESESYDSDLDILLASPQDTDEDDSDSDSDFEVDEEFL